MSEERLAEFRQSVEEMPHGPRCATRLDSPTAECSCDRMALLGWIDYVSDGHQTTGGTNHDPI